MKELIFASHNQGKFAEIKPLLSPYVKSFKLQTEINIPDVEETGLTFVENALLKARHAAQYTHAPVIADDSGLIVDALDGEPGLHTARYAGAHATALDCMQKLIDNLKDKPKPYSAHFYCVIVMLQHPTDPCPLIFDGRWYGEITTTPQGYKGFGYDPIFWDKQHQCTAAELPLEMKNTISHRRQALNALLHYLKKNSITHARISD